MENNGITITNDTTLGTLVTFFPDITRRLNDLHIDYCCHGNITIGEAVKEHRLSGDFLKELQDAYEAYRNRPDKTESVADMSTEDLISSDHRYAPYSRTSALGRNYTYAQ